MHRISGRINLPYLISGIRPDTGINLPDIRPNWKDIRPSGYPAKSVSGASLVFVFLVFSQLLNISANSNWQIRFYVALNREREKGIFAEISTI
jgi:hypothetical protein